MYGDERPPGLALDFNLLLRSVDIDPSQVVVLRHGPANPRARKILPWLASSRPDLFALYQALQSGPSAATMRRATYIAAFIGLAPGQATFAGLYRNSSSRPISAADVLGIEGFADLITYGLDNNMGMTGGTVFELERINLLSERVGKLTVDWPAKDLNWHRRAEANAFRLRTIVEESLLEPVMPDWDEVLLTWHELSVLPPSWRAALTHWRGIYFIFDTARRAGYVGSACGRDNLFGRWTNYRANGHGGNKLLRDSRPEDLLFSVLELTAPALPEARVTSLEENWKRRLHTRQYGLNAN